MANVMGVMAELPSGTVSLLFSDIEGSTVLLSRLGPAYAERPGRAAAGAARAMNIEEAITAALETPRDW